MKQGTVTIQNKTVKVSIPSTAGEYMTGLSKTKLQPNMGMLFDFRKHANVTMTMASMAYPLDMLFIKNDKVVDILYAEPGEEGLASEQQFDYVLEVLPNTFKHKDLRGALVTMETKPALAPVFRSGGTVPTYKVKVDDIPVEKDKMQILDKDGVVAANVDAGARIFSREHTLELTNKLRDKDLKGLVEALLKALDDQDNAEPQYVEA